MSNTRATDMAPRLLSEVCRERQIDIKLLCGGRILVLSRRDVTAHIYGWDFGVNSATALLICRNKAACSALLQANDIPCLPHEVYYRPDREVFGFPYDACWSRMIEFLAEHPEGVVCKPNDLSRGVSICYASSVSQLEKAAYEVFKFSRELSLSAFVPIHAEYRVIVLNGRCRLTYVKRLPSVTGDGTSTLGELIAAAHGKALISASLPELLEDMEQRRQTTDIPSRNEVVQVGWRHNLSHGATAELLDPTSSELRGIVGIAESAASALGVTFAAIDIVDANGDYVVLEVNTGIVTTHLLYQVPTASRLVKELYGDVIDFLFQSV